MAIIATIRHHSGVPDDNLLNIHGQVFDSLDTFMKRLRKDLGFKNLLVHSKKTTPDDVERLITVDGSTDIELKEVSDEEFDGGIPGPLEY